MQHTTQKIKRIKVDSMYGKKKHFNAADRKQKYHYWIGIPLVALNVIIGTALFADLSNTGTWVKYLPAGFAIFAALLAAYQTFFNFSKQVEGHRNVASDYLALMKKCDRVQGYIADKAISQDMIMEMVEDLGSEAARINKAAAAYNVSNKDYKLAEKGIKEDGEEEYTEQELSL